MSGLRDIRIGGFGDSADKKDLSNLPNPASEASSQERRGQQRTRNRSQAKASSQKELQKLRRVDLLELLVDQIRENEQLNESVTELTELSERLKDRLNQKDAQIEHLKDRLNMKDAEIRRLHEESAEIAHTKGMLDVHELLEVERRAVEAYLKQITDEEAAKSSSYSRESSIGTVSPNSAAAASMLARKNFEAEHASSSSVSPSDTADIRTQAKHIR